MPWRQVLVKMSCPLLPITGLQLLQKHQMIRDALVLDVGCGTENTPLPWPAIVKLSALIFSGHDCQRQKSGGKSLKMWNFTVLIGMK